MSAGAQACGSLSGRLRKTRRSSARTLGHDRRAAAAAAAAPKQPPAGSSPKNDSSDRPEGTYSEKCLRDESSPVAQFAPPLSAVSLSGLSASTARGGEAAAEAGEQYPRKERSKKLERDSVNLEISDLLHVALQAENFYIYQ